MNPMWQRHLALLAVSSGLFGAAPWLPQEQAVPKDHSAKALSAKELKNRQKVLFKELSAPDKN